ncbi:MAG: ATP-binding domain-containing protein, partial [Anaerolineae bacterium]|nr:ATP-binding domain-containing protein [Anaerolineae bacterium]
DVPSIDALEVKIKNLFGDNKPHDDVVTFCTVHKSKGLEADRVFILAPDKLPLSFEGITPEQLQQEYNLLYVAETRAKHVLVIVVNAKFAKYNPMPPYAQEDFEDKVWDADVTPVEAPDVTEVAETVTEEPDFAVSITTQLTALPSGIGLFSVDGDDKMFVARHIIHKGKFFVETINGDYIQETLSLDEALAKMEAFSPFIPLWNKVSLEDWGFATSKPKTVAERRAEKLAEMKADATPEPVVTVPDAPPPFAKTMHQRLNDLNGDYDPDTGLSADGETTTMYITTDLQNNFVVYERDYADQDDVKWSRDDKTKDIVTL